MLQQPENVQKFDLGKVYPRELYQHSRVKQKPKIDMPEVKEPCKIILAKYYYNVWTCIGDLESKRFFNGVSIVAEVGGGASVAVSVVSLISIGYL